MPGSESLVLAAEAPVESTTATARFARKLTAFAGPIVVYLAVNAGLPWYAGEFESVVTVAARQASGDPLLYGPAYRDNYYVFKRAAVIRRHPEVLVLGSSRSMQFRAGLFTDGSRFYNAGD